VAAGWGEAAEAPRCAAVLVLRRGGTAPTAGGSGRAAHPPSAPTRPAGRTTGVEGGRPRGVWRRRRWRRRYPAAGRVGRSRERWKRRLAACEGWGMCETLRVRLRLIVELLVSLDQKF
jgi:hypothetical protein